METNECKFIDNRQKQVKLNTLDDECAISIHIFITRVLPLYACKTVSLLHTSDVRPTLYNKRKLAIIPFVDIVFASL